MSNQAYLLNIAHDPAAASAAENAATTFDVAEAVDRIPLTWLFCFTASDRVFSEDLHSTIEGAEVCTPFVDVASAIRNLKASRPALVALAGSESVAQDYLDDAVAGLEGLPYDYLTIDYGELLALCSGEEADAFSSCYGPGEDALVDARRVSGYVDGVAPYPLQTLLQSEGDDSRRLGNANALCFGRVWDETSIALAPRPAEHGRPSPLDKPATATTLDHRRPWWKFWG